MQSIKKSRRVTRQDLLKARKKKLADIIGPGLDVLFCGINPGLYSAAVGHNFARPGNRFWPALFAAGFTDRQLSPYEERDLLAYRCGITNLVSRATASADELSKAELVIGGRKLTRTVKLYNPRFLAVVGITAYRSAFGKLKASIGLQQETIGETRVWVLPNPSGLNAHHQLPDLVRYFKELREHSLLRDSGSC